MTRFCSQGGLAAVILRQKRVVAPVRRGPVWELDFGRVRLDVTHELIVGVPSFQAKGVRLPQHASFILCDYLVERSTVRGLPFLRWQP